jgi:hypothetical protein
MPSDCRAAIAFDPLATPRDIGLSVPSFGSNAGVPAWLHRDWRWMY